MIETEHLQRPVLMEGFAEMAIPGKPKSRLQKHRLTQAGKARRT